MVLDQPLLISKGLFAWLTQTPAYYYGGAREVRVSESETKKTDIVLVHLKKMIPYGIALKSRIQ